jgi:LPS-assembly protein
MMMISALPVSAYAQGFAYNPGPPKPARPHVPADNQMLVQAVEVDYDTTNNRVSYYNARASKPTK